MRKGPEGPFPASIAELSYSSAPVAIEVTRNHALRTMPGVLDRRLGFVPCHARGALGGVPAAFEVGFEAVVPLAVGVAGAGLGAVAVGGAIVGVVVVLRIVVHRREAVGVVLVAGLIGAIRAVVAVPCVAHGVLGVFPAQARLGLGVFPAHAQVGFQAVVPAAVGITRARVAAVAVGGGVVGGVVVFGLVVRAGAVAGAPVLGFAGRI